MEVAREAVSVMAVFALFGAFLWTRRSGSVARFRGFSGTQDRQLDSIERLALTSHHSLHLVRIGGKEVVVATYPQGCAVLIETSGGSR
jgi:flagellar biogenesis protein FliO